MSLYMNQFLFLLFMALSFGTGWRFLCRLSGIKFCNNLGIDPIQLFFGENAQEGPCQIEGLEDCP